MRTKQEAQRLLKAQSLVESLALKHDLKDDVFGEIVMLVDGLLKTKETSERVQVRFHKSTGYYWVTLDGYCYSSSLTMRLAVRDATELLSLLDRGAHIEIDSDLKLKYTAESV